MYEAIFSKPSNSVFARKVPKIIVPRLSLGAYRRK